MNSKTALITLIALIIIAGAFLLYEKRDADNGGIVATSTPIVISTTTPVTTGSSTPATGTNGSGSNGTQVSTADIKIATPTSGATVSSPLTITGQARGNWFFEASAPVFLKDTAGKTIAQGHIQATGDWMTTNFVPFTGTLTWTASSTGTSTAAVLVFMNDNPSGNPSLQKTVTVPVVLSR